MSELDSLPGPAEEACVPNPYEAIADLVNACQILPNVFTGGQPSPGHLHALKQAGTELVLDLRDPMEPRVVDESALVRQLSMEYVNIPVTTGALTDETLERILMTLRGAAGRTIFCHCSSGARVGGALIPYLVLDHGMDEDEAVLEAMRVGLRSAELLEWGVKYARRHKPTSSEAQDDGGYGFNS
jgi:protein tyrosine phosphatase (PTP) superfamily phosphohydrolase (DUF442 family)